MRSLHFSPAEFHALAQQITQTSVEYLEQLPEFPSFPHGATAEECRRVFETELPLQGLGDEAFASLKDILRLSRPNSPRFFGYVFGSGLPTGALADYFASVANPNVTAWRSSPSAVTIERTTVRWLAEAIGCNGFEGSLTGGGSPANLMALCMAREAKLPANENGNQGGVIYCSSEAHMSIPKAAMLLGLGRNHVRRIAVDDMFRMNVDDLRTAICLDLERGRKPVAVVATAGTVTTGSIDPLPAIAEVCREHSLWLHVDGAYGALAALAAPEKFAGLNSANSISLDPHKWLYQPSGCGCLLYRDAAAARKAFAHSEEYARTLSADPIEGFAFFEESMELSRPFRALKVWLSLRYFGLQAFRQSIAEDLQLAQLLADAIRREPKLELLVPVNLSAVCFRHLASGKDLDQLNLAILKRVIERGRVYLSNASVNEKFALRVCIVNHRTTEEDVLEVVSEVLAAAQDLSQ